MYEHFKKRWKKIVGALLLVLGVLALVTPLTPGSWLIFVGAEMLGIGLLSRENVFRLLKKGKEKWGGEKRGALPEDL